MPLRTIALIAFPVNVASALAGAAMAAWTFPTPTDATKLVTVGTILGTALILAYRQSGKAWLDYLKDRDKTLAGTLTQQVRDLSARLDDNKETIDRLRKSQHAARNEANDHALQNQELRRDLLALSKQLTEANKTIRALTDEVHKYRGENLNIRAELKEMALRFAHRQNLLGIEGPKADPA